ncbi:endoplasmic reticulum-based factor for assembly of V-ATPase-domain-containing protein [Spinellus fusiger]|nr:endoplasmic reticulum-based factor for assembly of V-ATPase-domain-containing protein [Spinellus fusiger]
MQLALTPRIQHALKKALDEKGLRSRVHQEEAQTAIDTSLDQAVGVSVALLQELAVFMSVTQGNHEKKDSGWFHELLQDSRVHSTPPPPPPPKSPAFEAYLEQLRQEQAEKEYQRMVQSAVTPAEEESVLRQQAKELKQVKGHVATIVNILFSMVAVATAVFVASSTMSRDIGVRVLLSITGAVVIGGVETVLYVQYVHRPTRISKKQKKQGL